MAHEHTARVGQFHAVARPVEQPRADALFEPRQLLGERRLRQAKLLAGARERCRLGDRKEDAKLMQCHGAPASGGT